MNWMDFSNYLAANWLEIAGVLTTVVGVWLATRRLLICWPVVLVSDVLYLIVFYRRGCSPIRCCRSSSWPSRFTAGGIGGAACSRRARCA